MLQLFKKKGKRKKRQEGGGERNSKSCGDFRPPSNRVIKKKSQCLDTVDGANMYRHMRSIWQKTIQKKGEKRTKAVTKGKRKKNAVRHGHDHDHNLLILIGRLQGCKWEKEVEYTALELWQETFLAGLGGKKSAINTNGALSRYVNGKTQGGSKCQGRGEVVGRKEKR